MTAYCNCMRYLKERGEDLESVNCTGTIQVSHQLVEMISPSLLCIIAHSRLEGGQDGGEKWRRRRGGTGL